VTRDRPAWLLPAAIAFCALIGLLLGWGLAELAFLIGGRQ